MKYYLRLRIRTMLLCISVSLYNSASASIIIDNIIETEEVCNLSNGTISITAHGGSAPLSYSVDGGLTFQSQSLFTGLESNDYLIIVSDGTLCTEVQTAQITSAETPRISLTQNCVGGTGLVDIDLLPFYNGIPPFTFEWSGPDGIYDTEDLSLVPTGDYNLTIRDRDGCQVDSSFTIPICCSLRLQDSQDTILYNCITDFSEVSNLTFIDLSNSDKLESLKNLLEIELNGEPCNELSISIETSQVEPTDCYDPLVITRTVGLSDGVNSKSVIQTYLIANYQRQIQFPEFDCPADITIDDIENIETDIESWLNSFAGSERCINPLVINDFDFDMVKQGCPLSEEVEFILEDNCGGYSNCVSNISVGSEKEFAITCPEYIELGCSLVKPDSLIYQVLDSMTIVSPTAYEVAYDYSLDIYEIGCDFVYTFDADIRIFNACDQSAECRVRVDIEPEPFVYVPNTFSPGVRNVQKLTIYANPVIEEVEVFHIYNRWGQTVHEVYNFQANDESMGWNGTINDSSDDMEVYTYYAVCRTFTGKELKYAGNVTLLK